MNLPEKQRLSVVAPVFNERDSLPELWRRLDQVLGSLDMDWELIFVDDGSRDGSLEWLIELAAQRPEVIVLELSRNFGHQSALTAGLSRTSGHAVVLMDSDLQDRPEAIIDFVSTWRKGYEVVYAVRTKRKEFFLKRMAFSLFYRVLNSFSDFPLPLDAGIFSLMDAAVVKALRSMPERNRYLAGLRGFVGFRQKGILVERDARFSGEPKVSTLRLCRLAMDALFSFSRLPLRIVAWVGLLVSTVSFFLGVMGLYYKFVLGESFMSWSFGLTTILFLGGLQILFLGVIGEYLGRIYDEVKQRPYFLVAREHYRHQIGK